MLDGRAGVRKNVVLIVQIRAVGMNMHRMQGLGDALRMEFVTQQAQVESWILSLIEGLVELEKALVRLMIIDVYT